jgi:crotonobetainyl-CoA:carnitine CoA-transferase CaiB-like acyl-CoA transferase
MSADAPASTTAVQHLRVADFGLGLSAALVAKQFAELGATVSRIEPAAGDPFYDVYPAYRFWRCHTVLEPIERGTEILETADVCIIGGEDYPGLASPWDAQALSRQYPRLIVLQIVGYPDDPARPAVDLLVQARLGTVYEQFSQRPVAAGFPVPSYGAALQGLVGAWVALVERERSGLGQIVTISLAAGAAMFWGPFWMKAEHADAGFTGITPRDVRQLILRCAGDEYVQMTMGVPGALAKVHAALGIPGPVDPNDRCMPDPARGAANFYGDVDLLNTYAAHHTRAGLLRALHGAGVPAEAVLAPGECWDDEQTRLNGIIETCPDGWQGAGNPLRITPIPAPPTALPERLRAFPPGSPPLAGIKIIDCGIFVAGPYASKLLADYGADVIRVEPPTGRSTMSGERTIISANFGKRTICVDAKSEDGRAILAMLCQHADAILHNFRPGVSDRLGLDQKTMRRINPGLVTLETTAYGATGPKAAAPGFDMVMQAHCGLHYRAGGTGNPPLCSRTPLVDFATGAVGAIGLLVGLYERLTTGGTIAAESNLLNVGTYLMSELVRSPTGTPLGAPSLDETQTGFHPAESLYQTADGWVAIAARSNAMAAALAGMLALTLPTNRSEWGPSARNQLASAIRNWTTTAVIQSAEANGIWIELCRSDAWEQTPPDGTILRSMHDDIYGEVVHCIGPLANFSRSQTIPAQRLSVAPGQDTKSILAEHGISEAQVANWIEARVIV